MINTAIYFHCWHIILLPLYAEAGFPINLEVHVYVMLFILLMEGNLLLFAGETVCVCQG